MTTFRMHDKEWTVVAIFYTHGLRSLRVETFVTGLAPSTYRYVSAISLGFG